MTPPAQLPSRARRVSPWPRARGWGVAALLGLTLAVAHSGGGLWAQVAAASVRADSLPPSLRRALRRGDGALRRGDGALRRPPDAAALERQLQALGYLEARVIAARALPAADSGARAWPRVQLGPFYRLDSLHLVGPWPERLRARWRPPPIRRRAVGFSAQAIAQWARPTLEALGEEGFLSARLLPTAAHYAPTTGGDTVRVAAQVALRVGERVRLAELRVLPTPATQRLRERERFVAGLLRLRMGGVLTARAVADIPAVLDASPYYRSAGPPTLRIDSARATLEVPLRIERANRFDAVLGVLPPRQGQQEWQFTGLIDLALVSPLGGGEVLQFKYEELPSRSRRLDAYIRVPQLAATPLDLELRLNLLKQDSLFQTVRLEPALRYAFTPRLQLRLSYRQLSTGLLSVDAFRQQATPPPSMDGSSSLVGLGLSYARLDYPFNPRRGLLVNADVGIGTKTLRRARGLDSLDLARLVGRQARREWSLEAWGYMPIARQQTLVLGARGYWLDQAERFDNDLAFVGGARLLRGFNEQQFLASLYAIATVEYRLLFERDGYLGAFIDMAYLERRTFQLAEALRPVGYGISLQVPTAAGVLSLAYAIGQAPGQPPQAGRGRIHLGFISRF